MSHHSSRPQSDLSLTFMLEHSGSTVARNAKSWISTRYNLPFPPENGKSCTQSLGRLTNPLVRPKRKPQYSLSFINSLRFIENCIFSFSIIILSLSIV